MNNKIANYLRGKKENISALYTWGFDETVPQKKFGVVADGTNWLEKTISLKRGLREYLSNNPEAQVDVAHYFITEWGGIKRFSKSKETVEDFSKWQGSQTRPADFKPKYASVSSWSKWLSLMYPSWACIYDSRVAYSINAINYLDGGEQKIFPVPEGRNTRLNIMDISTLLLKQKLKKGCGSNPKDIKKAHFINERDAYLDYLDLMVTVSKELWGDETHIHEVEMLLFALADTVIYEDVLAKACE
jgi:hypothetical protein